MSHSTYRFSFRINIFKLSRRLFLSRQSLWRRHFELWTTLLFFLLRRLNLGSGSWGLENKVESIERKKFWNYSAAVFQTYRLWFLIIFDSCVRGRRFLSILPSIRSVGLCVLWGRPASHGTIDEWKDVISRGVLLCRWPLLRCREGLQYLFRGTAPSWRACLSNIASTLMVFMTK